MATRKVTRARPGQPEAVDVEIELAPAAPTPSSTSHAPTEAPMRTARGAFVASARGGRYELAYELASGGMATVYLARFEGAASFSRAVALKRIHPHLARDPRFVDMFLDEARISARLSHPNVCAVTDFGQDDDGGYYLAMEYLAGETLASVVRAALRHDPEAPESPRYRRYLAYLLTEAARGLQAAHETRGADGRLLDIVHRDVTPNNLFVTFDGVVKVVDFGIAKARDRVTQTDTGELKGSLPYVSPEQARSGDSDRRADVWSLGVCAWEAFTGRRLFKRQTPADTLYAVLEAQIPRVTDVRASVPAVYADAIAGALRREPSERHGSAKALGDALLRASDVDAPHPTASDIGAWLDELFPGGREARQRLVESTLRGEAQGSSVVPRSSSEAVALEPDAPPATRTPWIAIAIASTLAIGGVIAWRLTPQPNVSRAAPVTSTSSTPAPAPTTTIVEVAPTAPPASTPAIAIAPITAPAPTTHHARSTTVHASEAPTPSRAPRPTSAPTSSAASGAEGVVVIVVPDGWAEVYEGSRRLGTTPLRTSLSAAGHDLDVRIEGRAPGRRVHADVHADQTTRLVVRAAD